MISADRAYRVGLTGGIAAGKSTVARRLSEVGFTVLDADRLVADLYEPGEPGSLAVRSIFGDEALDADGRVDRKLVATRVFAEPALREELEAAIHPLVRTEFERRALQARGGVIVLEATLMVEAGFASMFDLVVTIEADPEIRLRRAVERGSTRQDAEARLRAQTEADLRIAAADVVIWNRQDLAALEVQVEQLISTIRSKTCEST